MSENVPQSASLAGLTSLKESLLKLDQDDPEVQERLQSVNRNILFMCGEAETAFVRGANLSLDSTNKEFASGFVRASLFLSFLAMWPCIAMAVNNPTKERLGLVASVTAVFLGSSGLLLGKTPKLKE